MAEKKNIVNYFLNGFSLLNKNIGIYLLLVAFSLVNTLLTVQPGSILGLIILPLSIAITVFQWGYNISVPIFFVRKQNGGNLDYQYVGDITVQTAKRLIIPAVITGVLFVLYLISGMVVMSIIANGDVEKMKITIQQLQNWVRHPNYIYTLPFSIIFAFLTFFPIFFSIEKDGFVISVKKSIIFSFRNLQFIVFLTIISIIFNFIIRTVIPGSLLETQVGIKWWAFLYSSLTFYPSLGITASALLYYQDYSKTNPHRVKTK